MCRIGLRLTNHRYEPADVILALSAYEKFLQNPHGIYGVSSVKGACAENEEMTIVVQDLGQFSGVKSAVHHFGHMLGAYHDGENESKKCSSCDGKIMSNLEDNRDANQWSYCSEDAIKKFVYESECLHNVPRQDLYPLLSWSELAHRHSGAPWVRDQCNNIYNTKNGSCGENSCEYLQCNLPKDGYYYNCVVQERNYPMEGTICGDPPGRCFQGKCMTGNKGT